MSLTVSLTKRDEDANRCIYRFGTPEQPMGQVVLHKESGDIDLVDPPTKGEGPNERYVLAHVVPRLQTYHDRSQYPDSDRWEV